MMKLDGGDYEIIVELPGLLEQELQVSCSKEHDRRPASEADEALLESTWQARLASNPSLFNGAKFRFAGASCDPGGVATLSLGLTDYRSFLGTNCAPHWERLLALSPTHLACPLGNAVIMETADEHVVLLRRGSGVGEAPNSVVMPGGHPEPEAVGVSSLADWAVSGDATAGPAWNRRVQHEMWDGMLREIEEETGVPRSALAPMRCIGFCRRVLNFRPDIMFHVRCALTSAEIQQAYIGSQDGSVHRDESVALFTVEKHEFVRQVLDENSIPMPGCHRGGVHLYRAFLASEAYREVAPK